MNPLLVAVLPVLQPFCDIMRSMLLEVGTSEAARKLE
jgi:hypothetical protein